MRVIGDVYFSLIYPLLVGYCFLVALMEGEIHSQWLLHNLHWYYSDNKYDSLRRNFEK